MRQKKALSSNNRTFLAMTIPIVILFFLFNTLPLITGAVYSFTNYRGYGSFDFVGLRNYIDLFSRIQLEELILEYQPTMLLVEHDRTFCRRVGTDFLLLDAE